MTPHTLNGFSVLIPDIPDGATKIIWEKGNEGRVLWIMMPENFSGNSAPDNYKIKSKRIRLPEGDWQLLKLSEVPELLAGEMVETFTCYETMKSGYKNYAIWSHEDDLFDTARASLTSWVRSKGVEGDPYLLIKKND